MASSGLAQAGRLGGWAASSNPSPIPKPNPDPNPDPNPKPLLPANPYHTHYTNYTKVFERFVLSAILLNSAAMASEPANLEKGSIFYQVHYSECSRSKHSHSKGSRPRERLHLLPGAPVVRQQH